MMTEWSDQDLRRAYAALAMERGSDGSASDVDLKRMMDLVEGRGSEADRLATLELVMADPERAREFELLRALAAGRGRMARRARWRRAALPLAAALVLAALPIVRHVRTQRPPDAMRDAEGAPILLAPPVEMTPGEVATFRWRGVPGARAYDVEILTAAGRPVFTTRTADTTFTLPSDVVLAPGQEHLWWVSAELRDGTQRRSPFRRLVVHQPT